MTYASGGLIEAVDYNGFVASVNALWGTGSGQSGYGQLTTLSTVAETNLVSALQWSSLIERINSMNQHQIGGSTSLLIPQQGDVITYLSTLSSAISTITTNKLKSIANGPSTSTNVANATTWLTTSTKVASLTWANANAMRYFFNAGGYITFTGANSVLTGNSKSSDWDALLVACGTIKIAADESAKVGGSGSENTLNNNLGFYDLTTVDQIILKQYSATGSGGYTSNYATFSARLNALPGTATQLIISMTLTDDSADEPLPTDSNNVRGNVILTHTTVPPSTSYMSDSWGTVTVAVVANTQA